MLDCEDAALGGGTLTATAKLVCDSSPAAPSGALVVAGYSTGMAHMNSAGGAGVGIRNHETLGMCSFQPVGARGESSGLTRERHNGEGLHCPEDGATPSIVTGDPEEGPALKATEGVLVNQRTPRGLVRKASSPCRSPVL